MLVVESEDVDAARIIDMIEAVYDILVCYRGWSQLDGNEYVKPIEAKLWGPKWSATNILARLRSSY